jgi:pimeloyl-ACP methyl ester carboxylesterase
VGAHETSVVIFLGGLQSHSQETPGDHGLSRDFAGIHQSITRRCPTYRTVFFSYRAGPLRKAGLDPKLAWNAWTYDDGSEPIYRAAETTDRPVLDHVAGLDWLVRDLLARHPEARIDLVGFSLGGVIALAWAADADQSLLARVHRVVLVSSPVGGITPLGAIAPKAGIRHILRHHQIDFGRGRAFDDLTSSSPLIRRLSRAPRRVDVASVENSRDYLVNGRRITGQVLLPVWMRTISLGRGVTASGFLPADQCYVADMGGRDRRLQLTHRLILLGSSQPVRRAHQHVADLISSDGPRWRERPEAARPFPRASLMTPGTALAFA